MSTSPWQATSDTAATTPGGSSPSKTNSPKTWSASRRKVRPQNMNLNSNHNMSTEEALVQLVCAAPEPPTWFKPDIPPRPPVKYLDPEGNEVSEEVYAHACRTRKDYEKWGTNWEEREAWDRLKEQETQRQWPIYWAKDQWKRIQEAAK